MCLDQLIDFQKKWLNLFLSNHQQTCNKQVNIAPHHGHQAQRTQMQKHNRATTNRAISSPISGVILMLLLRILRGPDEDAPSDLQLDLKEIKKMSRLFENMRKKYSYIYITSYNDHQKLMSTPPNSLGQKEMISKFLVHCESATPRVMIIYPCYAFPSIRRQFS